MYFVLRMLYPEGISALSRRSLRSSSPPDNEQPMATCYDPYRVRDLDCGRKWFLTRMQESPVNSKLLPAIG